MNWPHQRDCAHLFGNPSYPGWGAVHLTTIVPPFPMHMGSIPIHGIQINRIAAESLSQVLAAYWSACGHDPKKAAAEGADVFSGSWVVRAMRGINQVSMHAYGLAIDIDAPKNPLGAKPGRVKGSLTEKSPLVKCFRDAGWVWGGIWHRPDGMHFQAAIVG